MQKQRIVPRNIEQRDWKEREEKLSIRVGATMKRIEMRKQSLIDGLSLWWITFHPRERIRQRINVLWLLNNHFMPIGSDHLKRRSWFNRSQCKNHLTKHNRDLNRRIELHGNRFHFVCRKVSKIMQNLSSYYAKRYFDAKASMSGGPTSSSNESLSSWFHLFIKFFFCRKPSQDEQRTFKRRRNRKIFIDKLRTEAHY